MRKILMIEDNEANRYLVRFMCEREGYEVLEAETGEAGLELAKKENPDLILMDIQLPNMSGLEATKIIRESGVDNTIPIIALTSYAMAGDKDKALEAGCTGYIEKPINPETFIDQIEGYFNN